MNSEKVIEVFTDGASRHNPGLGAAGYIIFDDHNNRHAYSECFENVTNNRMEALAILRALNKCIELGLESKRIILYSDSAWAIGASFKNWNITANKDIIDEIRSLKIKFLNLSIQKVKGHSNCDGNNEVDALLNKTMNEYKG